MNGLCEADAALPAPTILHAFEPWSIGPVWHAPCDRGYGMPRRPVDERAHRNSEAPVLDSQRTYSEDERPVNRSGMKGHRLRAE
jgi:hypothetical protein